MDVNVTLDVPAVSKLLDYSASGVGAIAGSWFGPWMAGKRGEVKRIEARAEADTIRELAQAKADAHRLAKTTEMEISEMVAERLQYQETKRLENIRAVVERAAEELDDKVVSDEEPDHDWTARFFNYVQDISSEEMHTLWAKVLAGEVERAGSTSLHALHVLRNLDKATAGVFETFCSLSIAEKSSGDARVVSLERTAGENSLRPYGLDYSTLNLLHEHELIVPDYNSWHNYQMSAGLQLALEQPEILWLPFEYQREYWVLFNDPEKPTHLGNPLKLNGVALTRAGRELRSVVASKPNDEYTSALQDFFAGKNLTMVKVESPRPFSMPVPSAG